MKRSTIIKLAATVGILGLGVLIGSHIPDAEARGGKCIAGMNDHTATSNGYVCSSAVPNCSTGHEVFQPVYNSGKHRFDYKCIKSANVPH